MEERYVRCRRCHGVFESGVANCPRCGAEYVAIEAPLPSSEGSYEDKYKGTEYRRRRSKRRKVLPRQQGSRYGLLLGAGALLTVVALVVAMLFMSGVIGAPGATEDPDIVYPVTPRPSPSPTMPPIVDDTLRLIADPDVQRPPVDPHHRLGRRSRQQRQGRRPTRSTSRRTWPSGQTGGTVQIGNVGVEFRLVDGVYYSREMPNGAWAARPSIPPFLLLSPLFAITDKKADRLRRRHGAARGRAS